jgi:hypothetical protein
MAPWLSHAADLARGLAKYKLTRIIIVGPSFEEHYTSSVELPGIRQSAFQ